MSEVKRGIETIIPDGLTTEEWANWIETHQEEIDAFVEAELAQGKRFPRMSEVMAERAGGTTQIALRLPNDDLALAKQLAAKLGLPYQTYLKSLLHQALAQESG
jgi:predicted DNA binding CopG/RHH family protein